MKQEFDKEIDALLRRRAGTDAVRWRREDARPASPPQEESAHLDTDELSAYAENALPASARARYVTHLADCDVCRKIVVTLSSAANVAGELEKSAAVINAPVSSSEVSGWRAWIAPIFAPGVLRYAAPVLALSLIGAITFFALRTQISNSEIAGVVETGEDRRPAAAQDSNPGAATANIGVGTTQNQNPDGMTAEKNGGAPPVVSPTPPEGKSTVEQSKKAGAPSSPSQTAPAEIAGVLDGIGGAANEPKAKTGTDKDVAGATAGSSNSTQLEERPLVSNADDRARAVSRDEANRGFASSPVTESRRDNLSRQQNAQAPDGGSRGEKRSMANDAIARGGPATTAPPPPPAAAAAPRSSAGAAGVAARRRPSDNSPAKEEAESVSAEPTRNAAGHRFRRHEGAWIDVKYNSSMRMTGVRRGSEEFRALVADIPELGRIAEQIGGEVIAVIGNRAYRIR